MSQLIQPITTLLVGIALTLYGIVHAIVQFPDPVAFTKLIANLPAVTAVLIFILGLVAFAAGIVLIVLGIRNTRRRWRRFGQIARHMGDSTRYDQDNSDGWDPAYR